MPAPLTDKEAVKEFLEMDSSDSSRDSIIESMIKAASSMIRREVKRRFTVPRATEGRVFYPDGTGSIYLDEMFEESDITGVVDADGYEVRYEFRPDYYGPEAMGGYLLLPEASNQFGGFGDRPFPAEHSDWFTRNLTGFNTGVPPYPRSVTVTGTWGYATTPEEIEYLARRTVAIWVKGDISHFSETYSVAEDRVARPEKLPSAVRAALAEWKASGFVAV